MFSALCRVAYTCKRSEMWLPLLTRDIRCINASTSVTKLVATASVSVARQTCVQTLGLHVALDLAICLSLLIFFHLDP